MAGTLAACTRATKRAKSFFLAPLYDRVGCPNSVCVKLLAVYTAGICWSLRETAKSSCSTVEGSLAELSGRRQLKEQGGVGVLGCDSQEPSPVRDPGNNCTAARCRARRAKSNEVGGFRCPCPQNSMPFWCLRLAAFASTTPARAWEPSVLAASSRNSALRRDGTPRNRISFFQMLAFPLFFATILISFLFFPKQRKSHAIHFIFLRSTALAKE